MESAGLIIYISLADNLAEQKVGAAMGKEASGSLKNLLTIMTCTHCLKTTCFKFASGAFKLYNITVLL